MTLPITYDQVLREMAELIAPQYNDIYQAPLTDQPSMRCLYAHADGQPGCIVGQWLHHSHGVTWDVLAGLDNQGSIDEVLIKGLIPDLTTTKKARLFLRCIQWKQDNGLTYGEAFWYAITNIAGPENDPAFTMISPPEED